MKTVYIFLFICTVAKSQIPNLGFCPTYAPMPGFTIDKFLGKWYEAERYFQVSEVASKCVEMDFVKASNGRIYVSNELLNRITGVKRVFDGNLEISSDGKLNVKYATRPIPTETPLTVLETDYDSYAVVWSCSGLLPINRQSAWVMTRKRVAAPEVMQRAYGVLDRFKITRTFFLKTDQTNCDLSESDSPVSPPAANATVAEESAEQKD